MKKSILIFLLVGLTIQLKAQVKHIITSDSVDLYVTIKGEGIPCLYLHGGPNAGSYWAEKFAGDIFEKHFQMIYLDQRGCCRSTDPSSNDYSLDRMVKDFEEIRMNLGIDSWVIMGHSFGGIMQMGYINAHPEVIKGMIMINTTLFWNETMLTVFFPSACSLLNIPCDYYCNNDSVSIPQRGQELIDKLVEKDLAWKLSFSHKESFELMAKTFGEVENFNWGSEEFIINHPSYMENFKRYTNDIDVPVLFFYGKKDISVGETSIKGIEFPNMIFWGADVGHTPFIEDKKGLDKAITKYRKKYRL